MTKSFLINTSVAAIVSAFVFTVGVSSARAWDDELSRSFLEPRSAVPPEP